MVLPHLNKKALSDSVMVCAISPALGGGGLLQFQASKCTNVVNLSWGGGGVAALIECSSSTSPRDSSVSPFLETGTLKGPPLSHSDSTAF